MTPDTQRILIVEDEPFLREAITELFEDEGWQVLQSASAEEALELLARHHPLVVFTDIQLAGRLTGWDLGKACCEEGVPVVYTSGQVAPQSNAQEDGHFFAKPYDPDAVVAACAKLRA